MRDLHLLADAAPPTAAQQAAGTAPFDRALAALRDLRGPPPTTTATGTSTNTTTRGPPESPGSKAGKKGKKGKKHDNGGGEEGGGGATLRFLRLARGAGGGGGGGMAGPGQRLAVGLADERDELRLLGTAHRCLNRCVHFTPRSFAVCAVLPNGFETHH